MRPLMYLLIPLLIFSCNSSEEDCFVISASINMLVKSQDGKNLLDPKNPNAFDKNDIKLFYLEKGEKVRPPESSLLFYDQSQEYEIRIFPNIDKEEKFPITLIQWTKSDTDTIKCKIERADCSVTVTKVWFNEKEVVFEKTDKISRFFEIVK